MNTTARLLLLAFFILTTTAAHAQKTGIFDGQQDVGENVRPGAATYVAATRQYVVSGAGANVWGDHDEFQYVYKQLTGDFLLYARAAFVGREGVEEHRKLGWMVRASLAGNAPHVSAAVHGDGLTSLQFRRAVILK